jgi:hypothetical protein
MIVKKIKIIKGVDLVKRGSLCGCVQNKEYYSQIQRNIRRLKILCQMLNIIRKLYLSFHKLKMKRDIILINKDL